MPNSPKLPPKSPRAPEVSLSRRFSQPPPSKSSKLFLPVPNHSSRLRESSNTQVPPPKLQSQPQSQSQPQPQSQRRQSHSASKKQAKKRKKKKSCYSSCCCVLFMMMTAFLFVFILQESWDPDGNLAVKLMETEVLHDLTGPNVELPGARLAKMGVQGHFPVVFIPGIVSTGLEVWQGYPCAQKHFRQRFWGTGLMLRKILLAKQCWLQHIMLTPDWTDPPGIKLRPAQGLVAADYLVADYWVWARVIENLAFLGYDESNMYMASYDWRLPFRMLETRDRYFTRLKANIELLRLTNNNTRVALVAHSMGSNVVLYFLRWVENNFGSLWVEKNVESFLNIGGPLLGVAKTIGSLLSGEMRDTAELNPTLQFIKENFLSKEDLMHIFRSFGSLPSMMPKGIWPGPVLKIREDQIPDIRARFEREEAARSAKSANSTNSANPADLNSFASINATNSSNSANTTLEGLKPSTHSPTINPNETLDSPAVVPALQDKQTPNEAPQNEAKKGTQPDSQKGPQPETQKGAQSGEDKKQHKSSSPDPSIKDSDTTKEEVPTTTQEDSPPETTLPPNAKPTSSPSSRSTSDPKSRAEHDEAKSDDDYKQPASGKSSQHIETDVALPPYVNFTMSQAIELLRQISPGYMELLEQYYDLGFNGSSMDLHEERQWANPLLTPLPQASMRVYCMYGVGKPTEYSYYYRPSDSPTLPLEIDTSVNEEDVFHGVVVGDGDGTVPLLSLGYLCAKGWQSKELNPGSVPVVTREYQHSVMSLLEGARAGFDGLRGGYGTADHVDIMGNHHMLEDMSKILSNQFVDEVQDQYYSKIEQMSKDVKFESVDTVG